MRQKNYKKSKTIKYVLTDFKKLANVKINTEIESYKSYQFILFHLIIRSIKKYL